MKYKSTLARGLSHAWPWTKPIGSSPTASRLLRYSLLCMLVLLCGGNAWAEDVTLASGTFDGKNGNYTTGWSTTGTGTGRTDCIIIGTGENITSPSLNLSQYSKVTISIKARRYGNLSDSKATIDASIGGNSVGTTDATGTNATTALKNIEFTPTKSMTAATIVFTCTNATSAGSTHGAGIGTITITGTKASSQDERTETILIIDDAPTSGEVGNSITLPTTTVKAGETEISGASISWSSDNEAVAKIEGSSIKLLKAGTAKITATYAGDVNYKGSTTDFTITVSAAIQDGVFDFTTGLDYGSGDKPNKNNSVENNKTWTAGNIIMTLAGKNCWWDNNGTYDLRLYAASDELAAGSMTFTAPTGKVITKIIFTGSSVGSNLTTEDGTYKSGTWTGSSNPVTITSSGGSTKINTITVTYGDAPTIIVAEPTFSPAGGNYEEAKAVTLTCTTEGATIYYSTDNENFSAYTGPINVSETTTLYAYSQVGEEKSATVSATYNIVIPITTASALNAAAIEGGKDGKPVTYNFTNAKVVYVNGSYNYIADETGCALLYKSNLGLTAGKVITGTLTGTAKTYSGLPEIAVTTIEVTSSADDTDEPTPTTISIDELANNVNNYIKVENAEYVSADGKKLSFKVGETNLTVYNQFGLSTTGLTAGKIYNITGFGSINNSTNQIYPTAITEYVAPTPAPLYILGDMANWDRTNPTAMAWDSENEVYTYTFTSTAAATYFCFADGTQTAEEAAADNEWTTFNSTYRIAYNEGGYDAPTNSETPIQLAKVNSGDATIILPAGQWTISVSADMKMTITGEATPVTPTEAKYYVVGNMTAWDVDKAYEMTRNEGADIDEYSFTMDLTTESQFKVVKVEEGKENVWYPDGMGNNYGENGEITADGTYTIYFRPNYDGGNDWFYNCIYVAAEEEPEPFVFRDIKLDLTVQGFLTDDEYNNKSAVTAKLLVDEEGNISRNDDATEPNVIVTGNTRKDNHGWDNFTMTVPVTGKVKITIGGCEYNSSSKVLTVTPEGGEAFTIAAPAACWHSAKTKNIKSGYFDAGEQTVTLTITGPQYTPYVAIEAVDEIPSIYTVTYAKESDVEGTIPAEVEVTIGEAITLPKNYTLYKEGYTQSGWTDGNTTFELGASYTPEDDVTLTAVFTENEASLSNREDAVTITYALDGTQGNHNINNSGVVVTQATIGDKIIDVAMNITAGSLVTNNSGWHQVKNIFKATIPSAKGATVVINTYDDPTNLLTFGGSTEFEVSGSNHAWTATYTATADATSLDIAQSGSTYWNKLEITLPKVESTEPGGEKVLYSWESPEGTVAETGGKIEYVNGEGDRLNYQNNGYYTICLNGKKTNINDATPSANAGKMVITLDKALHEGDKINMTAYITNSAQKTASAYVLFETGTSIDGEDYSDAANIGLATPGTPTTTTITVPKAAAGSKTITLTRSKTGTNLFITKLVITTTAEDDPNAVATPEITPATGTYTTEQEVTITCETEDAKIYYTTDGTDPTAQSTEYTAAFTVSETTTVKAIAIKGEYSSEIAESVITITTIQPGTSNLEWDYTEKDIPTTSPDNGLNYAGYVNDDAGTNNGLHGVKLNSSGYAWFTKNPVEGKLTLTFGNRKTADAFTVNVYSCDANGTKGDKIGEVSVAESPGTGSIDIAADVTGIYIERSTSAEGVLQKIVFKEKVARTFKDFEITNEQLKGTIADMNLPQGVTLTGTQPEAGNNSHGYINASISVPTDGGAVKFTFGGCQYANKSFTVTNSNNETIATLSNKTTNCYHQDASVVTYFYTGEATTLTFSTIPYLPYFKAEATDVQEVTVTFKDQNGTELGKKTVLEGQAIGEVPFTEANLTIPEGEKFRGWVYASGVKVQATDIVSGSITVKASVTPIETVTEGSIQTYDLTKSTFYPEDHETIKVENAAWHDSQHGFSVANGSTISVQTAGKAQVVVTLCQHSAEGTVTVKDANGNSVGEGFNAKVATCGTTAVVNYDGEATWLTFTFSATAYIHSIKVYNVTDFVEKDEESGWYIVPANDGVGLVLALNAASQEADGANIFLPNGTYDLGETVLTAIGGKNVSLIGESMDGVIIKNAPPVAIEGLKTTATLHNTGENLYLQDLTIQNALDYYSAGSAGRGIAFWDEGKHTIAKNVKLLSYQDTYLSTVNQQFYWETSEIHGAVDFICGGSDVFFESTKIVTESRAATGKSGEATITAPQPGTQEQFGYVFNNCTIENNAAKFNLGRAWGGNSGNGPKQAYLNTTIMQPDEIISTRFTTAGMNEAAKSFKEYNSKNSEGTVISPTSNILKFTHSTGDYEYETILSETEAANYALDKVFPSWAPNEIATQIEAPVAELKNGVISWEKVNGATAYALFNNGSLMAIVDGETTSYTVENGDSGQGAPALRRAEDNTTPYTLRAANGRGGFGEPKIISMATGIKGINAELNGDVKIYDMQGRQVKTTTKGVYIINGKKVVIK